jgi:hypothetical protein
MKDGEIFFLIVICLAIGGWVGASIDIKDYQLGQTRGTCESLGSELAGLDYNTLTCKNGVEIKYRKKEEK